MVVNLDNFFIPPFDHGFLPYIDTLLNQHETEYDLAALIVTDKTKDALLTPLFINNVLLCVSDTKTLYNDDIVVCKNFLEALDLVSFINSVKSIGIYAHGDDLADIIAMRIPFELHLLTVDNPKVPPSNQQIISFPTDEPFYEEKICLSPNRKAILTIFHYT